MILRLLYIIPIALFIKCSSNPVSDTLDGWKKNQDSRYWYGVSIIDKANADLNIQKTARNEAIADIASQIKIKINQDFKKIIQENDYEIKEYSTQILESQIENNLEQVEILDYKDLGDTYMLYARLSKNKYYAKIESQRENAKKVALDYINKIFSPSAESFRNLSKAESEIFKYIDSPMSVIYKNKSQNLYLLIQSLKEDMINNISIKPSQYEKNIKNLIPSNDLITVNVFESDTNMPISNIPLFSEINNGIDYCYTNDRGECDFYIDKKFINKDLVQHMYIGVDQAKLYGNEYLENHFDTKVDINLLPLKVCLEVDEYNLNNKVLHPYIEPVIKEFLIKELNLEFSKSNTDCDMFIYVSATTKSVNEGPNEYGIYQVFGNATIDVNFLNKEESVLNLAINNIQGASFNSEKQAATKSLENISNKIFNETLVELVSILKQN